MKPLTTVLFSSLFITLNLNAEVKLPSIFSDNMVLQQKSNVAVWGKADPFEKVTVNPSWQKKDIVVAADENGNWKTHIKTPSSSENASLIINDKTISNILIGEVWLCSGQSNMEYQIAKSSTTRWLTGMYGSEDVIKDSDYPSIRVFTVKKAMSPDEALDDCEGEWKISTPENAGEFSAVAYIFGRDIHKATKQPVGLVVSAFGGTHAESWTKGSVIESDEIYAPLIEAQKKEKEEYPVLYAEYQKNKNIYEAALKEAEENGVKCEMKKPASPKNPATNNKTLSTLWNAMINPILPYTVKGTIWYQGESNSIRHETYTQVFSNMIYSWREEFENPKMPFYFVQIAPHHKQPAQIREAQLNTFLQVPYTGMTVITDVGDSTDIHPRNKLVPGERLALWALKNEYGKKIECSGPVYNSMRVKDNKAVVSFDYAGKGLKAGNDSNEELKGFEVAGEDGVFYPATAEIKGKNVELWSEKVDSPTDVRYGWGKFFRVNLYNEAGLPASPFRTGK